MNTRKTIAATLSRRHGSLGLLLACTALISPVTASAQSLFPTTGSALPSLSSSQIGTAGTTTVTRNTTTALSSTAMSSTTMSSTATGTSDLTVLPGDADAANAQAADAASGAAAGTTVAPGGVAASTGNRQTDRDEDLNQTYDPNYDPSLDNGAEAIDQQDVPRTPGDPTGIRLGSFMLRPSINQSINSEKTKDSSGTESRGYLATGIRGSLSSDWSRHALTVNAQTTLERDISGDKQDRDPEGRIDADLRLDLADQTVAHLTSAYSFSREENDDPNAVSGAKVQSGVSLYEGGASLERSLGLIHALGAIDVSRYTFTDAKLSDGSVLEMQDRNRTGVDGRLRLGYELSPAIIPFAELAAGHTFYDHKTDASGYERSSQSYAIRTGIQFDLGEKLRGEIGTGYEIVDYEDPRLKTIGGVTFDGKATWSPQRGTDVDFGLRSTVQDSTTAGESGWVEYDFTAALAHQMRENFIARLTTGATYRNFDNATEDNVTLLAGTGFTWNINRYFDLTGDLEYQRTTGGTDDQSEFRAGVGISVKR